MKKIYFYFLLLIISFSYVGCYNVDIDNPQNFNKPDSRLLNKMINGSWNIKKLDLTFRKQNSAVVFKAINNDVGTLDIRNFDDDKDSDIYNFIFSSANNVKIPIDGGTKMISYPLVYYKVRIENNGEREYYTSELTTPYNVNIIGISRFDKNTCNIDVKGIGISGTIMLERK